MSDQNHKDFVDLLAARAAARAEIPVIIAKEIGDTGGHKYLYADLPAIHEKIGQPLRTHGMSIVHTPTLDGDGTLRLVSRLYHDASGVYLESVLPVFGDTPQAVGKSLTYNRRYATACLLDLVVDEDDDAASVETGERKPERTRAAPATTGPQTWRGTIAEITHKSGTSAKGKKWTLYTIVGADGTKFGTFDAGHADVARSICENKAVATITWEQEAKGRKLMNVSGAGEADDEEIPF